jgi:4,5-dihydroxyphthalate decarboxylase
MDELQVSAVSRTQGNNAALKSGAVTVPGVTLNWVEIDPLVAAFRRMVRATEFDVCEMAITTYLCAKEHGKPFTALPVPLVRDFHHGAISVLRDGGVTTPKDLEGARVGVNRGYTVTTGVWARGILSQQYGVDLDRVEWVLSGDEHVAEYRAPANVVTAPEDRPLIDLLRSGYLAAVIGVASEEDVVPLIADPTEAAFAALEKDGLYPINHVVVVRDELLARSPDLAARLFEGFAASKRAYVEDLRAGRLELPGRIDAAHLRVMDILGTDDPLPYGLEPNLAILERLVRHASEQHILRRSTDLEQLFAAGTHDLVG